MFKSRGTYVVFGRNNRELSRHDKLSEAKEAAQLDGAHKLRWKKVVFKQDGIWHVEYASNDAQTIKLELAEESK
jgi:hypothetical protein